MLSRYLIALSSALTVIAQSEPVLSRPKLAFRPEYIDVLCRKNGACSYEAFKKGELSREAFQACEKRKTEIMKAPWPAELGEFVPGPIELVEHLWTSDACGRSPAMPVKLPADFRRRLDHVVFRDPDRNVEFKSFAGSIRFVFVSTTMKEHHWLSRPRRRGREH